MEPMKSMTESLLILAALFLALNFPEILTRRVSMLARALDYARVEQMFDSFLGGHAVGVLVGDLR